MSPRPLPAATPPPAPSPSSPGGPSSPLSTVNIVLISIGSILGLLAIILGGAYAIKMRRRALRRLHGGPLRKQKLAGSGASSLPKGNAMSSLGGGGTDEARLRAMMGVKIPTRAHVAPHPPVNKSGGGGVPQRGSGSAGFKWEEEDRGGMRNMMRKLSVVN